MEGHLKLGVPLTFKYRRLMLLNNTKNYKVQGIIENVSIIQQHTESEIFMYISWWSEWNL